MGAHWQVYRLYAKFAREGWLKNVRSIVDFGSTDTSLFGHAKYLEEFLYESGKRSLIGNADPLSFDDRPIACLFRVLGYRYECIDIDKRPGTIQLDLNFEKIPDDLLGQFDFVCDNGTFEHILNQSGCFKAAHDICAIRGLMFFHKPFIGHYNHGFFNYQPDLFIQLARANRYEILGLWRGIDVDPGYEEITSMEKAPKTEHAILFALLRKTQAGPFRLPYNMNGSDLMGREQEFYEI